MGAITAQGPPSNCSNAVDSDSLNTNPNRRNQNNGLVVSKEKCPLIEQSFILIPCQSQTEF